MIYDISQPVFTCRVYPGDSKPERMLLSSMEAGDTYNLTAFSMCAHNGTHIDAPLHFIPGGKSIDKIAPEKCIGPCYVSELRGDVTSEDAARIIKEATEAYPGAEKRILLKGDVTVTLSAAEKFAAAGICLIGNESQSVGPADNPKAVHVCLLSAEVVLLEGICLGTVPEGAYTLFCLPLNLNGAEGAPCRAVLRELQT